LSTQQAVNTIALLAGAPRNISDIAVADSAYPVTQAVLTHGSIPVTSYTVQHTLLYCPVEATMTWLAAWAAGAIQMAVRVSPVSEDVDCGEKSGSHQLCESSETENVTGVLGAATSFQPIIANSQSPVVFAIGT
jgi:hypothetical protein